MRVVAAIGFALLTAGCNADHHKQVRRALVCNALAAGYGACAYTPWDQSPSTIWKVNIARPARLAGPPPDLSIPGGFWVADRLSLSPDGRTLLAQWSGACESQSTYLISTRSGKVRAVFTIESMARGWTKKGRARVFLGERGYGRFTGYKPGLYLVDPKTMARTLVHPVKARLGC